MMAPNALESTKRHRRQIQDEVRVVSATASSSCAARAPMEIQVQLAHGSDHG
jgi:hypothetical protein